MRPVVTLAALALAVSAAAQQPIGVPKPPEPPSASATNRDAGDGMEVELATLAGDIGSYDHKRVRTRGVLELLPAARAFASPQDPEKFLLRSRHSNAALLVIPAYGLIHDDLRQLAGSELLVLGIVRMLRAVGQDVADRMSPELPPVPMHSPDLPRVSITVISLSGSSRPREDLEGQNFAKRVLENPAQFAGKTVHILGQFRGRNLFGDLPEASRRKKDDWVLKDGDLALWISDRPPKGRGFTLDLDYKSDTSRWVEVEGKPEVVDGVLYVRASKVTLATRKPQQ